MVVRHTMQQRSLPICIWFVQIAEQLAMPQFILLQTLLIPSQMIMDLKQMLPTLLFMAYAVSAQAKLESNECSIS